MQYWWCTHTYTHLRICDLNVTKALFASLQFYLGASLSKSSNGPGERCFKEAAIASSMTGD